MISVVINADNRAGYLNDSSKIGEFEVGQPNGTRSVDFLTWGLKNKINYFRGYDIQCVFFLDEHLPIHDKLFMEINEIVKSCGNNSKFICKPNDRSSYRWNDMLYIEALKLAEGTFVCHMDNDTTLYRKEGSDIVEKYFKWLNEGYKYICQPWDKTGSEMVHASTRFFICKKETLDFPLIEKSIMINPLMGKLNPCLEFTLGHLAGDGKVLYPEREDSEYVIFCWSRYFKGTLEKLSKMPYGEVRDYILECGLFGCNDVFDKMPAV